MNAPLLLLAAAAAFFAGLIAGMFAERQRQSVQRTVKRRAGEVIQSKEYRSLLTYNGDPPQ